MTGGERRFQWTREGQGMLFDPIIEQPMMISASRAAIEGMASVPRVAVKVGASAVNFANRLAEPALVVAEPAVNA